MYCRCGHSAYVHPVQGRTTKYYGGCSACLCKLFVTADLEEKT